MSNDNISDFLARIKNAYLARHKTVEVPFAKTLLAIGKIFEKERYIEEIKPKAEKGLPAGRQDKKILVVVLSYPHRKPAITGIQRISKPGLRVYVRKNKLTGFFGGLGIIILSTPKGIMNGREARKKELGGEVICKVW